MTRRVGSSPSGGGERREGHPLKRTERQICLFRTSSEKGEYVVCGEMWSRCNVGPRFQ